MTAKTIDSKVQYRVKKATLMRKMCTSCGGTGKCDRKIQGVDQSFPCTSCTNGVAIIEHQTEVTLIEALTELGIRFILPQSMKPVSDQD